MTAVPKKSLHSNHLEKYMECEKCGAGFDHLYIGGVGDWRTTIMCEKCHHVHRGVPFDSVIVPLVARQYDISEEEARRVENESQRDYEATLAEETSFGL